jgi:hypothetical protein
MYSVIAGLDPAIHCDTPQRTPLRSRQHRGFMDARVKPGHDAEYEAVLCAE